MNEALIQAARNQAIEAWREAWWNCQPHTQLLLVHGIIYRDGCLKWYQR